jgi:AcrR family transcriptional regulator
MTSSAVEESIAVELDARSGREIAILRAAYHVMARSGSNRLNLQDIADEAGVSKGLILYHFQTKNAVLQHAMQWALLETARRIRTSLELADDPADRLGPLLDAIFVSPQANRDFHLVYLDLIEHAAREQTFAELPAMSRSIIETLYADVIGAGAADGLFDVADVEEAALLMRVVIDGTFLQWLQRSDWQDSHAAFKQRCHDTLALLLGA